MKRLAVVLAMGLAPGAWAQPTAPVAGLPHSPAYYLLQALLSLAVVIALIYGATWLLRRVGPGRTTAGTDGPAELLQSVPLQGGYVLHVARVGKKLLALTCGPGGVAAVEVDDEAEAGEEQG